MDTSALNREISEKATFSKSNSASRLSALVFIYAQILCLVQEGVQTADGKAYSRYRVCGGDELVVMIVHQRLTVTVKLSHI